MTIDHLTKIAYHVGVLQEKVSKIYDMLDQLNVRNLELTKKLSKLEERHNNAASSAALAEDVKRRMQG